MAPATTTPMPVTACSNAKQATVTSQQRFSAPPTQVFQSTIIGCPKETKPFECRVGLTPACVCELVKNGHTVVVETGAGVASGFTDACYQQAGAQVVSSPEMVYKSCQMIVKVCAPQPQECCMVQKGQVIMAFFYFETSPEVFEAMRQQQAICISYEQIQSETGMQPVVQPMCEIAGHLAVLQGMKYLEKTMGGVGKILGCVSGVSSCGSVLILGGGVAATQAARIAAAMGAQVCVMDVCMNNLRTLAETLPKNCTTTFYCTEHLNRLIKQCDLVIGAVMGAPTCSTSITLASMQSQTMMASNQPKNASPMCGRQCGTGSAPILVTKEQVCMMKPGSVVVDLAMCRGGNFETSRPTTMDSPTFVYSGVIHCCVPELCCTVPQTASAALSICSLLYVQHVANKGWRRACVECADLTRGLTLAQCCTTCPSLAKLFPSCPYTPPEQLLKSEISSLTMPQTNDQALLDAKQKLKQIQDETQRCIFTVEA